MSISIAKNTRANNKVSLKDFEIIEEISKGSFGIIKLVKKKSNKSPYILKIISKNTIK